MVKVVLELLNIKQRVLETIVFELKVYITNTDKCLLDLVQKQFFRVYFI